MHKSKEKKLKNMEKNNFIKKLLLVTALIAIAAFMRLVPHWPNLTPVAAIALFGGATLNKKWLAILIPVSIMLISDLFIGFHDYVAAVYLSFIIAVFMGFSLSKNKKFHRIALTSIASSILFFIITNFAVWYGSPFYPQEISGLMSCYAAGLPFFNDSSLGVSFFLNGIIGDMLYNFVFFGILYLITLRYPALAKA